MRRRFARLSVHRKLVAMALMIATVAVVVAMAGLVMVDLIRFRADAEAETEALAKVLADNVASAVRFDEIEAAYETLSSVRVRTMVLRACVYLPDGQLYAGVARDERLSCAPRAPEEATGPTDGWDSVWSSQPIPHDGGVVGHVFIERALSDLRARVLVTMGVGMGMLAISGALALLLAHRLHRSISRPIAELARAAGQVGRDDSHVIPSLVVAPDDIGDLVRSFSDMAERVVQARTTLTETNDALRREIDERQRMEVEREELLERERHSSHLKDEFLATLSHELRTPLNAILGWAQILRKRDQAPAVLSRAVASIDRNARAQTLIIEDLLDISRIVTGQLHLHIAVVDLRPLVEGAVDAVRPTAGVKGVTLHVDLVPSPCLVVGDGERLQQVLWNLVANAVKFTARGGTVEVTLAEEHQSWTVRVRDTGIGMDPAFLPHIFERFRQGDGSMTREHGGLGLGLAIARDLTHLHGGTIIAESDGPGRGSTFTVRVPVRPDVAKADVPDDEDAVSRTRLKGVSVLIVDDSLDTLEVLGTTLRAAGARVDVASSAEQALAAWKTHPGDVLLCDLAMPQMDGYALLRRLRKLDAQTGRLTPAIAVTAHASADQRARSHDAGFEQHLTKPCSPFDVIRAVATAVAPS